MTRIEYETVDPLDSFNGTSYDFSVVIPCLNGEATLERQLLALTRQSYKGTYEILVADNGSSDSTPRILERFSKTCSILRVVDASGSRGINHARNRGVEEAKGDFIVFCDADDEVDPEWLSEISNAVRRGAVAVGGSLDRRLPTGERVSLEQRLYTMFWDIPWPAGANCGFSRSVYDAVGPFDEDLMGGSDETDYFWRIHFAGFPLELVETAVVRYYLRDDLGQVYRQARNYGASHVKLYAKYRKRGMPRSKAWRSLGVLLYSCVGSIVGPKNSLSRRKAVERLGAKVGRIRGSLREGVLYL